MKVPCVFHGGPLDGQTREHVPWRRFEVLISDPLPVDAPRDNVPFSVGYYEPDPGVVSTASRIEYVYRGEYRGEEDSR